MTPRQERFVQEYLLDLNATQAAIRAGYSEKTANEQGAQLLKKPEIAAAIDAAKAERADRADIDAFWVLRRLVDEAEADLADLFDKETGQVKPVHEWPEIFRKGLVQSVESEELYEGSGQDREHIGRVRKLRFSDRHKRTELIGKHVDVNAFQDLIKHNMHEDLAKRLERAAERWGAPTAPVRPAPQADGTPPSPQKPEVKPHPLNTRMRKAGKDDEARETDSKRPQPQASEDWNKPAPPAYSPILSDWPEGVGHVECDYASLEDGLIGSRNKGDKDK